MNIVSTSPIDVVIRKASLNDIFIAIEVASELKDSADLINDLAELGHTISDNVKVSNIGGITIINMVAETDNPGTYSHRQYLDIVLRLAEEMKVSANMIRLEIAYSIIETLDKIDAMFPKSSQLSQAVQLELPAQLQVAPVVTLVEPIATAS